jgi:hypothetical protein
MRDYYGLAGVFASTRMVNRRADGSAETSDAQGTNLSAATLHVVEDSPEPKDLPVFLRGNVERKGPVAERRFLRILSAEDPKPLAGGSQGGSGRGGLAMAIASRENPLTARVFVNRIWAQFFGRPLVASESNFGHSGQLPTHPELLDDLAVRFMDAGWSVKWQLRELVLSSAYRQTARLGPTCRRGRGRRSEQRNARAYEPSPAQRGTMARYSPDARRRIGSGRRPVSRVGGSGQPAADRLRPHQPAQAGRSADAI